MIGCRPTLVNAPASRYPALMNALTIENLRVLAAGQGLQLSDEELGGLLPLVQATSTLMQALRDAPLADVEPSSQYRIF